MFRWKENRSAETARFIFPGVAPWADNSDAEIGLKLRDARPDPHDLALVVRLRT
jgi:hypothetical protein